MTPEEKADRAKALRAKQLRAKAASVAPQAPQQIHGGTAPATPDVGGWEAAGRGAAQGVTLGMGEEASAFLQALAEKVPALQLVHPLRIAAHLSTGRPLGELVQEAVDSGKRTAGRSFGEVYRGERDSHRRDNARAEAARPEAYIAGSIAGGMATAPLLPGAGPGRTLAQLMGHGAKLGAGTGAAFGLGSSNAELTDGSGVGEALGDTALGGTLGAALGGAAPAALAALGGAARYVAGPVMNAVRGGYIVPTPEAQRLMAKGANLTLGRMDPASLLGRFEEVATSKATGGSLKALRSQGDDSVRDVLLQSAGAPGAKPPTAGAAVTQQLDELRAGFGQIYDEALDGVRLQPEKYMGAGKWRGLLTDEAMEGGARTRGAFELAASARDIDASPAVRERALSWLTDKAQTLMPTKSGPNAGTVEAKSIQALRTQLRDKIRNLGGEGDDRQLREIYGRAEEFVSELLENQLPPDKAAALKGADAAYRNLLSVEDAARRAIVQEEKFTPAQLLMSIRKRGAAPEVKALAHDAQSVLGATYPLTGVQSVAGEVAPVLKYIGPGFAHLANTVPQLRSHALTQQFAPGLPVKALDAAGRGLQSVSRSTRATSAGGRTLLDLLMDPQPQPAWAP